MSYADQCVSTHIRLCIIYFYEHLTSFEVKMATAGNNLVVLTPIEYQGNRIVRYYGYKLTELDANSILSTLEEVNVREMPNVWQEGDIIFYQYPRQPLIAIRNGQFFTTRDVWENREFSHRKIRHQASILLRIFGRKGLATYNRKAVPRKRFTPRKWRKM